MTPLTIRIAIDRNVCAGHGRCYVLAPDLFECDAEGFGVVTVDEIRPEQITAARHAVLACPEEAIVIEGENQ